MRKTENLPLVVDLDGKLTLLDALMVSVISVVRRKPSNRLCLPFWLAGGRAALKVKIAERADFRAELLPYREILADYLVNESNCGCTSYS